MPLFPPTQPSPLIIADEVISLSGIATTTLSANVIYLYAFELNAPTTFTGGKWRVGATAAGTSVIGIYSFAGTLQGTDTGATTNVTATNHSVAFTGGNITLPVGQYFAAFSVSDATCNLVTQAASNSAIMSRCRQATNSASGGLLNAATGGYSDTPTRFPAFALTVSGGLT